MLLLASAAAGFKSLIGRFSLPPSKKKRHTDAMALLVLIKIALIHPGWRVSGCPSLFLRVEDRSGADEWLSWPTADVGTAASLAVWWSDGWKQWEQSQGGSTVPSSTYIGGKSFKLLVFFLFQWLVDNPWVWIWIRVPRRGPWEPNSVLHFAAVIWRPRLSHLLWFHTELCNNETAHHHHHRSSPVGCAMLPSRLMRLHHRAKTTL